MKSTIETINGSVSGRTDLELKIIRLEQRVEELEKKIAPEVRVQEQEDEIAAIRSAKINLDNGIVGI